MTTHTVVVAAPPFQQLPITGLDVVENGRASVFRLHDSWMRHPTIQRLIERQSDINIDDEQWQQMWDDTIEFKWYYRDPGTSQWVAANANSFIGASFDGDANGASIKGTANGQFEVRVDLELKDETGEQTIAYSGRKVVTVVEPAPDLFKKNIYYSDESPVLNDSQSATESIELANGKILRLSRSQANRFAQDYVRLDPGATDGPPVIGVLQRLNADLQSVDTSFGKDITIGGIGEDGLWSHETNSGIFDRRDGALVLGTPGLADAIIPGSSNLMWGMVRDDETVGQPHMAVDSQGRILIAMALAPSQSGYNLQQSLDDYHPISFGWLIFRYTSEGAIDPAFGTNNNGCVYIDPTNTDSSLRFLHNILDIQIASDGSIWIAGTVEEDLDAFPEDPDRNNSAGGSFRAAVMKLGVDGGLLPTQGYGLYVFGGPVAPQTRRDGAFTKLVFQEANTSLGYRVIAAGFNNSDAGWSLNDNDRNPSDVVVAAFLPNLHLDSTFGLSGTKTIKSTDLIATEAIQSDLIGYDVDAAPNGDLVVTILNAQHVEDRPASNFSSVVDADFFNTVNPPTAQFDTYIVRLTRAGTIQPFGSGTGSNTAVLKTYSDGGGRMLSTAIIGSGASERVIVAGYAGRLSTESFGGGMIYSLMKAGTFDTEFGSGGYKFIGAWGENEDPEANPYPLGADYSAGWTDITISSAGDLILSGFITTSRGAADTTLPIRGNVHPITARYDPRPPRASDLSATLQDDGSVDLRWSAGSTSIRGFEIRRSLRREALTGGTSNPLRTTFLVDRQFSFVDRTAVPNQRYFYKVYPIGDSGASDDSNATNTASVLTWPDGERAVLQDTVIMNLGGRDAISHIDLDPDARYQLVASGLFDLSTNNPSLLASMQSADAEFAFMPNAWVFEEGPNDRVPYRVQWGGGIDYGISVRSRDQNEVLSDPDNDQVIDPTSHSSEIDENKGTHWSDVASTNNKYAVRYMLDTWTDAEGNDLVNGNGALIRVARPIIFRYHDSHYYDNTTRPGADPLMVQIYRFAPSRPAKLEAVANLQARSIELKWKNLASDATSIIIERAIGDGAFQYIGTVGAQVSSFVDSDLISNKLYRYQIKTRNSFGDSDYSNEASAVITNTAPTIRDTSPQVARFGQTFEYRIEATDAESSPGELTYSIKSKSSGDWGATLNFANSHSPVLTGWTPSTDIDDEVAGRTYWILIEVKDPSGLASERKVFITIAPSLPTIPTFVVQPTEIPNSSNPHEGLIALTTLASDDKPESELTYIWETLERPTGAPVPTFSVNRSNSAKQTFATVKMAGNYRFKVTAHDDTPWTAEASTEVIVVSAFKTGLKITPTQATIASSSPSSSTSPLISSKEIRVTRIDQFGQPFIGDTSPITWSIIGASATALTPVSADVVKYTAPPFDPLGVGFAVTITPNDADLTGEPSARIFVKHERPDNKVPVLKPENIDFHVIDKHTIDLFAPGVVDPDGPENKIEYFWEVTKKPNPSVPFVITTNGSNAAKHTTFSFPASYENSGLGYEFQLKVWDDEHKYSNTVTLSLSDNLSPTTVKLFGRDDQGELAPLTGTAYLNISKPGTTYKLRLKGQAHDNFFRYMFDLDPNAHWQWSVSGPSGSSATLNVPDVSKKSEVELSTTAPGLLTLNAEAWLAGSTNAHATASIQVLVIGEQPPTYEIIGPANGAGGIPRLIDQATPVSIVADDPNPGDTAPWTLRLRDPEDKLTILATSAQEAGTAPASPANAVTLNPNLYRNGLYTIELVEGTGSNLGDVKDTRMVRIESFAKSGALTLPVTDLTLDLPDGQKQELTRVYDSTRAGILGEFGYGWRYELKKGSIRTSSNKPSSGGSTLRKLSYYDIVYVEVPGVGQLAFAFMPKPEGQFPRSFQSLGTISDPLHIAYAAGEYHPQFVSVDGSSAKLSILNPNVLLRYDITNKEFYGSGAQGVFEHTLKNFGLKYLVTLADGTTYKVDADSGETQERTDPNGNVYSYTASRNLSIKAEPDTDGRIHLAGIWDASLNNNAGGYVNGKTISYEYTNGELTKVTDREGIQTSFEYGTGAQAHFLKTIKDPSGLAVLTATYTDQGTLTELKDAASATATVVHNSYEDGEGTRVTDANGDTTETIRNSHGDVIREVKTLRNSDGSVREYLITTSHFDYRTNYTTAELGEMVANGRSILNRPWREVHFQPFTLKRSQASLIYQVEGTVMASDTIYDLDPDNDTRGAPKIVTTFETNPDDASHPFVRETKYFDFKNGRPQVVEDENHRYSFFKYDDFGNLLWMLDANGVGTYSVYSDGSAFTYEDNSGSVIPGLTKGLPIATYRVRMDSPLAPAPGEKLPEMNFASFDHKELTTVNRYYHPNGSLQGSGGKLESTTEFINGTADTITTSYTYTSNGDTQQVTRTVKNNGVLESPVIDSYTEYDSERRAVKSWQGAQGSSPFTQTGYDNLGRVSVTRDQFGGFTVNTIDKRGSVIRTNYPDGTETRSFFDKLGRASWTSERFVSSVTPTVNPTTLAVTWPAGGADNVSTYKVTRTIFDSAGRAIGSEVYKDAQITLAIPSGETLLAAVEPSLLLLVNNDKRLSSDSTVYNGEGRVSESVSATGLRSGTIYYADGRIWKTGTIVRQSSSLQPPSEWTNLGNRENNTIDYLAEQTIHEYGRSMTYSFEIVTDPSGAKTETRRSFDGLTSSVRRYTIGQTSNPIVTTSVQAPAGQLVNDTTIAKPTELTASLLGNFGTHSVSIDEMNRATHRVSDGNGRLTDVWLPPIIDVTATDNLATGVDERLKWSHWHYTYDASGNELTQTDPRGKVTSFKYDDHGRRTMRTLPADDNPGRDYEMWSYDDYGRVKTHTDFMNQTTAYQYDTAPSAGGRLQAEYRFDVGVTSLVSGVIQTANAAEHTEYAYDSLGRQYQVSDTTAAGTRTETTTFDPITGQVASVTTPEGTINYAYDPKMSRLTRTWTLGNDRTYEYDSRGRLSKVIATKLNGQTVALSERYVYDVLGRLDLKVSDNGTAVAEDDLTTDYIFDGLGRLDQEIVKRGIGTLIFSQDFVLRDDGQRESVLETRDDGTTSTTSWQYDDQGHLTREERAGSNAYVHEFAFDLAGNRIFKKINGVQSGYQYNDRNQLNCEDANNNGSIDDAIDTRYAYDANGATIMTTVDGVTCSNKWSLRGRLVSIDQNDNGSLNDAGDVRYGYDSHGVRVSKSVAGGGLTAFVNDPQNLTGYAKPIEEKASLGGPAVTSYVYGSDVIAQFSGADATQAKLLVHDGRGYTRTLVTINGSIAERSDYTAFGQRLGTGVSQTRWQSPDGYYDPETGAFYHLERYRKEDRFISQDTTLFGAGETLDGNLYGFVAANAMMNTDASGLFTIPELLIGAVGVLSIVSILYKPVKSVVHTASRAVELAAYQQQVSNMSHNGLISLEEELNIRQQTTAAFSETMASLGAAAGALAFAVWSYFAYGVLFQATMPAIVGAGKLFASSSVKIAGKILTSDVGHHTIFKCAMAAGVKQPLYWLPRKLHVGPNGLHTRLLQGPFTYLHPTNGRSMEQIIDRLGAKRWLDDMGKAYEWLEKQFPGDYPGIVDTFKRAVEEIGGVAGLKFA